MDRNVGERTFCSSAEAATLLGVVPETVQRWARTGRLRGQKMPGRTGAYLFDRQQVESLAASRKKVSA